MGAAFYCNISREARKICISVHIDLSSKSTDFLFKLTSRPKRARSAKKSRPARKCCGLAALLLVGFLHSWRGLSGAVPFIYRGRRLARAAEELRPSPVAWVKRRNTIYLSRDARVNPALLLAHSLGPKIEGVCGVRQPALDLEWPNTQNYRGL